MADVKVGVITFDIYKLKNGDFEVRFPEPVIDAPTPYDFVKMALLAGEVKQYTIDQTTVVNMDDGNNIRKLSELAVDHDMFYKQLEVHRQLEKAQSVADVDKYQTKLPFEEENA